MTTIQKIIAGAVVVIGLAIAVFHSSVAPALGAQVQNDVFWFTNGVRIGSGAGSTITGTGSGLTLGGTTNITTLSATTLSVSGASALSTLTQGGGIDTVATTSTSYTLAATDFDTENVVAVTPGGASLTLTLPASSTLPLGTTAGSMRTVFIQNATTTAGINITMAAGTGETLRSASSTLVIQSDTSGAKGAALHFVRKANSDILVFMTTYNN